jgi:hypothetical protein
VSASVLCAVLCLAGAHTDSVTFIGRPDTATAVRAFYTLPTGAQADTVVSILPTAPPPTHGKPFPYDSVKREYAWRRDLLTPHP